MEKWNSAAVTMQEFATSGHAVFRCSTSLSKGVLKSSGIGKLATHYTADPSSLKTIVAVKQLRIHRAVTIRYINKSTADTVDLNENLNISPKPVANIAMHEPPDVFDQASRKRLCIVCETSSPWTFTQFGTCISRERTNAL